MERVPGRQANVREQGNIVCDHLLPPYPSQRRRFCHVFILILDGDSGKTQISGQPLAARQKFF
jgi:hypothetical protein